MDIEAAARIRRAEVKKTGGQPQRSISMREQIKLHRRGVTQNRMDGTYIEPNSNFHQ
jgi:hypothetical protein